MLTDDYTYYKNQSKNDLWDTLCRLTAQQKRNGELDAASMEETYRLLSPMLDDKQRRTLRAVLDALQ